jgi:hypothetical protein
MSHLDDLASGINDVTREVLNLSGFPIVFETMRPLEDPINWYSFTCDAGARVHLPHGHYRCYDAEKRDSDRKITTQFFFGDSRKTRCPFPVRVATVEV